MAPFISYSFVAAAVASVALASPLATAPLNLQGSSAPWAVAPLMAPNHPHGTINNSYIVMLKPDVPRTAMENHFNFLQMALQSHPLQGDETGLTHVYDGNMKGYAGKFSEGVVEQIRSMPEVDFVEYDQIVKTQEPAVQRSAPWGLARVSHRPKLGFSTFTKYEYDNEGGKGVDVYVIDTGIHITHNEFEGRASWGRTMPTNDEDEDGNGHGTHCAGTIASRKYGVAKAANVIAVKVLGSNGSGSMSDVVGGVEWASKSAKDKAAAAAAEYASTGKTTHRGSVSNMSLGGGKSRALDQAVDRAVLAGMHFAVAAGNDNRDACNYSPAAAENAVTVGASTLSDDRAYFSNYGKCVDIFAPGLNILSTWTGSDNAVNTISGTSMASPHTAGILAYLLSLYPSATFDPSLADIFPGVYVAPSSTPASLYAFVRASLPSFVQEMLPPAALIDAFAGVASTSIPILTPLNLKKALIALSTRDALSDLPEDTVNLLIFNNATSY